MNFFAQGRRILLLLALLAICFAAYPVRADSDEAVYAYLSYGTANDNVLSLQIRLRELSFFQDGLDFTPSVFDDATQNAVELFCQSNHIAYVGTGASAELQKLIFSQGAIAYTSASTNRSLPGRMRDYFGKDAGLPGIKLPVWSIWLVAAVIIVLIFVSVWLLLPKKPRKKQSGARPAVVTVDYWSALDKESRDYSLLTQQKAYSGQAMHLTIHIRYRGRYHDVKFDCPPEISIGRKNCMLTLERDDKAVSGKHCELFLRGAMLMLRDHSSNGTGLNGRKIHNCVCRIHSGDHLCVGEHELYVQY